MDPSIPAHSPSISAQDTSNASADQKLGSNAGDQQKLESLITEKLNTFEGVASKQEIRQMMKEVMQEFMQGNGKGIAAQGQKGDLVLANQMQQGAGPQEALSAQKSFLDMADKASNGLLRKDHGPKLDSGNDALNPFSQGGMGMLHPAQNPVANGAVQQTIQVSRDSAQMIADIANQIVDRIQVNTNSLNNMQEVRISFGNNILPNTDVLINLTGNQLNVTFIAGSQQASQFLSQSNLSQLQNTLKSKLGDDKILNVSLKKGEGEDAVEGALTDHPVMRREQADDASSF